VGFRNLEIVGYRGYKTQLSFSVPKFGNADALKWYYQIGRTTQPDQNRCLKVSQVVVRKPVETSRVIVERLRWGRDAAGCLNNGAARLQIGALNITCLGGARHYTSRLSYMLTYV
jgi:hypothetical protein